MTEKKTNVLSVGARIVLHVLSKEPMTIKEIEPKAGMYNSRIRHHIKTLRDAGLIYQAGTKRAQGINKGPSAAVYASHVPHADPRDGFVFKNHSDAHVIRSVLSLLDGDLGPLGTHEIASLTGIPAKNIAACIHQHRRNHGNKRLIRIADWAFVGGLGGGWKAQWGFGKSPDAQKPPADKRACQARYREKNRQVRNIHATRRGGSSEINQVLAGNPFAQLIQHTGTMRQAARMIKESA